MTTNLYKAFINSVWLILLSSCMTFNQKVDLSKIEDLEDFSSLVLELLSDENYLRAEVQQINASQPSIQRIIYEADLFWNELKISNAVFALERALRINKNEPSVYLRLAHIKMEEGYILEAKSFASRGLMIEDISSWERVLLGVYLNL